MMRYFAQIEADGTEWLVTFPDVPEAITGGADRAEALENAQDALEIALLTYAKDGRAMPDAKATKGAAVTVSASVAIKVAFIEAFNASGMTRTALAQKLEKQEGEVRRMLDPYHRSKLASMEMGLRVLGKQLIVSVQNAA